MCNSIKSNNRMSSKRGTQMPVKHWNRKERNSCVCWVFDFEVCAFLRWFASIYRRWRKETYRNMCMAHGRFWLLFRLFSLLFVDYILYSRIYGLVASVCVAFFIEWYLLLLKWFGKASTNYYTIYCYGSTVDCVALHTNRYKYLWIYILY